MDVFPRAIFGVPEAEQGVIRTSPSQNIMLSHRCRKIVVAAPKTILHNQHADDNMPNPSLLSSLNKIVCCCIDCRSRSACKSTN